MSARQALTAKFVLGSGALLLVLAEVPKVVEADILAWIVQIDALFHSGSVGGELILASLGWLGCSASQRPTAS